MNGPDWCLLRVDSVPCVSTLRAIEAQLVKNPPVTQDAWVQSLDWEDALEEGKATHSSILAWRIPWSV